MRIRVLSIPIYMVALLAVALPGSAIAQSGGPPGGWDDESVYGRRYDSSTVETVQGQVIEVGEFTGRRAPGRGVHLRLQTDRETIAVHLGPAYYVDFQEPKIEVGDRVTVTGSRIEYDGAPAILAATVEADAGILKLRDEMGVPRWSGGCDCGTTKAIEPPGRR